MTVQEQAFEGAVRAYAIGGTPADCVKLGLMVLCPEAEAVVSGVNRGYNVGTDILYSGTVAAAMEGAICGRAALAVSQSEKRADYEAAAQLAVSMFEKMMENPLEPLCVLNLNYPSCDAIRGVVTANMEPLYYRENYVPTAFNGKAAYALHGEIDGGRRQSEDYQRLCEGYATVTILRGDLTDRKATNAWNALI